MAYSRYFVVRKVVSKQFRDEVETLLPNVNDHPGYWRFLEYLMFGAFYGESGNLLIPRELVAQIEGREALKRLRPEHYTARNFLDSFKRDVLQGFDYKESHGGEGLAREVRNPGLTTSLYWLLRKEWSLLDTGQIGQENKVYFSDGSKFNESSARAERKSLANLAETLQANADNPAALDVLDYLNNLPTGVFSKLRSNLSAAKSAAERIVKYEKGRVDRKKTRKAREANRRLLRIIEHQAKPFYQASSKGNTVRVFPLNESVLMLSKEVRRELTKGWAEYDLRSSQLAIVATLWDIPEAKVFLQENLAGGPSIWQSLFQHYEIESSEEAKKVFKEALYSLVYGMNPRNIK